MKQLFFSVCALFLFAPNARAQDNAYVAALLKYQKAYVEHHEVVEKDDKQFFRFFPVDATYRVEATFTRLENEKSIPMKTSGTETKQYFRYGKLSFSLDGQSYTLTLYQSQALMSNSKYRDYLFLPFTDLTSGEESYGGGRYIDFRMAEIKDGKLIIDFNKAYNPYCAYVSGYNCPVPPRENDLPVAIKAGEKAFGKAH